MRSRRRKGRRNRDGLWICGIAVLAAGAVFTARTEILDLVTTEIAFVLDPKQEGGEKESDQDIAERVESTDGGKETLTDGGVDLAETDEAGADYPEAPRTGMQNHETETHSARYYPGRGVLLLQGNLLQSSAEGQQYRTCYGVSHGEYAGEHRRNQPKEFL